MTRKASETTKCGVKRSLSKLCSPEYNSFHYSCRQFHYEGNCECNGDITCRKQENLKKRLNILDYLLCV